MVRYVVSHFAGIHTREFTDSKRDSVRQTRCRVPDGYLIVLTTVSLDTDPAMLGRQLVEERLAACVNVLPEMDSFFRWRGAVERDQERQVLIKTTAARLPDLERRLHELHPYELPEFLVIPILQGSEAYLRWVSEATSVETGG
jgi:periplasmic divalent cation tolerance protein